MRLIKYSHACVRIEDGDRALTIDPGIWTEPEALTGAQAVLVTHEHFDHVDAAGLIAAIAAQPDLRVYAHPEVLAGIVGLGAQGVPVSSGERFDAAGFRITAVGGQHAEIIDGLPGCANVGFIVDDAVYHPGDSVFVPDQPISHLLVPVSGPWLKLAEAIDFTRTIKPAHAFPIHDALLSEVGAGLVDRWLDMKGGTAYRRLNAGEGTEL